jgi:hypothetical protein
MAKKFFYIILSVLVVTLIFNVSRLNVKADTFSQSYNTNIAIPNGSLVSLRPGSSNQIIIAELNNNDDLLGVTVSPQASLVNLNSNGGNVQVVTSGSATVLVSDINGDINQGDSLTTSPIAGVAMKATAQGKIIGYANTNFNNRSLGSSKIQLSNNKNEIENVAIGSISANIMVGNYQNLPTLRGNGVISAVQAVAISTTGKSISTARALLALLVLIVAVVVSILILYTAVASSIRSIGRNPLSRHSILQSLIQVIIAVIVIMLSGFSIVYLIIGQ